jgi:hypothetical protein
MKGNIHCLPVELEFNTMLYHALLFNSNLSDKHKNRVREFIKKHKEYQSLEVNQISLIGSLSAYFLKLNCYFIPPNDNSVYFNYPLLENESLLLKNKKRRSKFSYNLSKIIRVKTFKKYTKITFLSFLKNEIDVVFEFRFRFWKKTIRFCLGNRPKYKH